jgi:hypothetical protein
MRMPALLALTIFHTEAVWDISRTLRHSPLLGKLWISSYGITDITCSAARHDDVLCSRLCELTIYAKTVASRHARHSTEDKLAQVLPVSPSVRPLLNGLLSWCVSGRDLRVQNDNMHFADLEELTALPVLRQLQTLTCDLDRDHEPTEDLDDKEAGPHFNARIVKHLLHSLEQCPALTSITVPSRIHMNVPCDLLYPLLRLRPHLAISFFGSLVTLPKPLSLRDNAFT